jgi:hypothetical protein
MHCFEWWWGLGVLRDLPHGIQNFSIATRACQLQKFGFSDV